MNSRAEQRQADRPMTRQDTQPAEQRANQEEASTTSVPVRRPEVERSSASEARFQRESSTLSGNGNGNGHHKSVKLPDPPIFTGTGDPTWET